MNYNLMNLNLLSYSYQTLVYATCMTLSFLLNDTKETTVTQYSCRLQIAFDFFYWLVWVSLLTRTSITSYMNVKFSKTLQVANRQFLMVFN